MSIIVEFTLRSPRLVLTDTMRRAPDVAISVESVDGVPPEDVVTMLWATGGDLETFDDAIRADPTVTDVALLEDFEGRRLYRYRVAEDVEVQMYNRWLEVGAAQLNVGASGGEWHNRVRFPDRDALREFQAQADEAAVEFTVQSIYDEPDAPNQSCLTEAQSEALELALETGYLEVPRDASLAAVAEELGVSEQSVSERLRRAMRNLSREAVDRQS
ncbi:bacteriocin [Halobacterium sp. DL1]|jgi:hypothetical protein|nr:bacteriocin [Halobacterium sp. DL1]